MNSTVIDIPKRTKFAIGQRLLDISKVCGIKNIHSFKGFNSFYDFLRKTFFHTRYILVTNKDTIKSNTFVYNLSVKNDESYVVNNGIVHNCRCVVVQVRKDKYPESNERKALNDGSQATAGKHQEMFKFNPGKQMTTFPAYNAYTIRKCKECKLNNQIKLAANIPDNELCAACKVVRAMVEANEELKIQRLKLREWANKNLIGKTVLVHKIDKPIEFSMKGIKETLNQPHQYIREKNKALLDIVNLLKESEYISSKLDDKNNPMVHKYHYLKITVAGKPSYAVIREMKDGKCMFYSIVEKLKKKKDD